MKKITFVIFLVIFFNELLLSQEFIKVSPNKADTNQTINISIFGYFSDGIYSLFFIYGRKTDDIKVNSVVRVNEYELKANITIGKNVFTREYDIFIKKDKDTILFLWGIFHVNGLPRPIIKSIIPNYGRPGDTVNITIVGENTHFLKAGDFKFHIGNGYRSKYYIKEFYDERIINDTIITLKYIIYQNENYAGHSVEIYNEIDNYIKKGNAFLIYYPWIKSVTPQKLYRGNINTVKIVGVNTHFLRSLPSRVTGNWRGTSQLTISNPIALNDTIAFVDIRVPLHTKTGKHRYEFWSEVEKRIGVCHDIEIINPVIDSINILNSRELNSNDTLDRLKFKPELLRFKIFASKAHFKQAKYNRVKLFNDCFNLNFDEKGCIILSDTVLELFFPKPNYSSFNNFSINIENDIDSLIVQSNDFLINGITKPQIVGLKTFGFFIPNDTIRVEITGQNTHFKESGLDIKFLSFSDTLSKNDIKRLDIINDTLISLTLKIPFPCEPYKYNLCIYNNIDCNIIKKEALNFDHFIVFDDFGYNDSTGISKNQNITFKITKLFPNPVVSNINLQVQSEYNTDVIFKIINLSGIIHFEKSNKIQSGNNELNFNLTELKSGVYILKIIDIKHHCSLTNMFIKK